MSSDFSDDAAAALSVRSAVSAACARAGATAGPAADLTALLRDLAAASASSASSGPGASAGASAGAFGGAFSGASAGAFGGASAGAFGGAFSGASAAGADDALSGERPLLDAAEAVLGAYGGFGALPPTARAALSSANLCDLAALLGRRPPLAPPVLAAVFQLSVVAAKAAPPAALDAAGCPLLVALLELLGALPRAHAAGDAPSLLRIARIAARNVMRRVGPRVFAPRSPAAARVDAELLPWVERHLLPLHAVSGASARADLREDRRLALALLEYAQREEEKGEREEMENDAALELARRVRAQYLADAARVLLQEDDALEEHERDCAAGFLARVDGRADPPLTRCTEEPDNAPDVPHADVHEFLLAREEEYAREGAELRAHIREEQGTAGVLQRQLDETTAERDKLLHEIQQSAQVVSGEDEREWSEEVLALAMRVEQLAVERQMKSIDQL